MSDDDVDEGPARWTAWIRCAWVDSSRVDRAVAAAAGTALHTVRVDGASMMLNERAMINVVGRAKEQQENSRKFSRPPLACDCD